MRDPQVTLQVLSRHIVEVSLKSIPAKVLLFFSSSSDVSTATFSKKQQNCLLSPMSSFSSADLKTKSSVEIVAKLLDPFEQLEREFQNSTIHGELISTTAIK